MNKTKIDWTDSSFNFIQVCYHTCEYCYARGIANRFKTAGELIEPETYRLEYDGKEIIECNKQPYIIKDGKEVKQAYPYGFTPCYNRYQHENFKAIKGRNVFMGSMSDMWGKWVPDRWLIEILMTCEKNPQHNFLFLTKNPARYIGEFKGGAFVDWVIVGAETGNRKGKVIPQKEWIKNIVNICRQRNIPVFMKESLRSLMGCDFIQEFPKELAPTD